MHSVVLGMLPPVGRSDRSLSDRKRTVNGIYSAVDLGAAGHSSIIGGWRLQANP